MKKRVTLPDEVKVCSVELRLSYTQPMDTSASTENGSVQYLYVETVDVGGGDYVVIETERWAGDDIDGIIKVLQHAKQVIKKTKEEANYAPETE